MDKPVGMMVDTANSKVIVQFDREVGYIELSPRQAIELADTIVKKAMTIGSDSGLIIPTNFNG